MRTKILHYKKNIVDYDILTQFSINNFNKIPNIALCEIQIKRMQLNETKQICLNLATVQLIGNTICFPYSNTTDFKLTVTNKNKYIIFENIFLLAYKNILNKTKTFQMNSSENSTTIKCNNLLNAVENFSLYSNFIKLLEKTSIKTSELQILCKIDTSCSKKLNIYFLKSLSYPF